MQGTPLAPAPSLHSLVSTSQWHVAAIEAQLQGLDSAAPGSTSCYWKVWASLNHL